jgi:transcriptional regulator with XRE-family HTH domain
MADWIDAKRIGKRIAAVRQTAALSQGELAQRVGWPRDTLINYEHGRRALSVERLAQVARALEVHPAVLLTEDEQLAILIQRLATDTELLGQVAFFIEALASED